jgi:hypothetical protein
MTDINAAFHWKCEPESEALIELAIQETKERNGFLKGLEKEIREGCSSELISFLDHAKCPYTSEWESKLIQAGFVPLEKYGETIHFYQPAATLPHLVLDKKSRDFELFISVESIAQFLMVRGLDRLIDGTPFGSYRRALVSEEKGSKVWVVERRGEVACEPVQESSGKLETYLKCKERWMSRPRSLKGEEQEIETSLELAQEFASKLGKARAACLVLECERAYWQAKNRAGQLQKNRQDAIGMGWANHDHHTFRSSRKHFMKLVTLFETLGFACRERFYAGEEAGWGAQVMENPEARSVLFLDVDLSPEEIAIDFAHHPFPERHQLGTIGLWCSLHGDSIGKGGMHHLEAQFDFGHLTEALKKLGIDMMDPFSNFSYLKQAFTKGEVWPVDPERVQHLLTEKKITKEQAERFLSYGAIGSHMENLQRKEGYKGFNQKNVSLIIKKTDPRALIHESGLPQNG